MQVAITAFAIAGRLKPIYNDLRRISIRLCQASAGVLLATLGLASSATELERIRYSDSPLYTRVVFDLTAPPVYQSDLLENPARFFIDIRDARLSKNFQTPFIESIQFRGVRFGQQEGSLRSCLT